MPDREASQRAAARLALHMERMLERHADGLAKWYADHFGEDHPVTIGQRAANEAVRKHNREKRSRANG